MSIQMNRYTSLEALSRDAALRLAEVVRKAAKAKGRCALVLSGGRTPRLLYECLARAEIAAKLPWQRLHLFWGDERCVPPDSRDSNYRTAREALISRVPIPESNVHPMPAGEGRPETAARVYEDMLRAFFDQPLPGFDLVLLGMGADGHTASLFPGDAEPDDSSRWVRAARAPEGYETADRLTLSLPALCSAERVFFLVAGPDKAPLVKEILERRESAAKKYPAARVAARNETVWFVHEGDR